MMILIDRPSHKRWMQWLALAFTFGSFSSRGLLDLA